jgi:hypothetical protein
VMRARAHGGRGGVARLDCAAHELVHSFRQAWDKRAYPVGRRSRASPPRPSSAARATSALLARCGCAAGAPAARARQRAAPREFVFANAPALARRQRAS